MGKIYFNRLTGEFWEACEWKRKPPEGFEYTGYRKDYRCKPYLAKSYFCPECNEYHFYINLLDLFPLHAKMRIELTEKYGCSKASKIVRLGFSLGGRTHHYVQAERLSEMGLLDKWFHKLESISDDNLRRKAVKMLLDGADENDVEALIIAETLKNK
ncbi:MAG: hypothetical protein QXO15_03370 [Nitrososphaerota archaeon]